MQSSISLLDASKEEIKENSIIGMEMQHQAVEVKMEFWPLQHPLQPDDQDRPVICPFPHSSLLQDGRVQGKRTAESWRKRDHELKQEGSEERLRAERKRHHHSLSRADYHISPLPPLPSHNITIFHRFDS